MGISKKKTMIDLQTPEISFERVFKRDERSWRTNPGGLVLVFHYPFITLSFHYPIVFLSLPFHFITLSFIFHYLSFHYPFITLSLITFITLSFSKLRPQGLNNIHLASKGLTFFKNNWPFVLKFTPFLPRVDYFCIGKKISAWNSSFFRIFLGFLNFFVFVNKIRLFKGFYHFLRFFLKQKKPVFLQFF
jgi:hypothetical protein